jgi:two-component system, NtrC family, sensor kinase
MKTNKILLFLLCFLQCVTLRAQEHTMDSVKKMLKDIENKYGHQKGIPGLENGIPGLNFDTGTMFYNKKQFDAVFEGLNKSLEIAKSMGDLKKLQGGYYNLTKLDSTTGNYKKAYEHYKLYTLYRDSLVKEETDKKALQAKMQFEFDKKQAIAKAEQNKKDAEQKRIKNIQYFTIAALVVLLLIILLIVFIQWKNNKQKKKANDLLQLQKEKVENTLTELKSMQAQLIQSEKMASLGELTAGIAHEIQNPLNFVNNFSEVNRELVDELQAELKAGNTEEAIAISNDIKDNEEKISHHGHRADSIVKGMLLHSRSGTGVNELTDINALADEYLHLAYHGMRARNKEFNITMRTDFDKSIGKIKIIPQDMGRVLLNLYNNALYAVHEKLKQKKAADYEPAIFVSTKKVNHTIELTVRDNGVGIPHNIIDKIFQPFFTTKPTGQGTGLGLSLSYDIIKAQGGEIKVNTLAGESTEFIVSLPV